MFYNAFDVNFEWFEFQWFQRAGRPLNLTNDHFTLYIRDHKFENFNKIVAESLDPILISQMPTLH